MEPASSLAPPLQKRVLHFVKQVIQAADPFLKELIVAFNEERAAMCE
jgi:hypothetical protein